MLYYAVVFFIIALIAALFGFGGIAAGDTFRRKLVRVAGPTLAARRVTVEILDEIDAQVQRYLLTMMIINTLIGLATWGILLAFGMNCQGVEMPPAESPNRTDR